MADRTRRKKQGFGKENQLPHPLQRESMPRHLAVIMDGNGRWAKSRGMPRTMGHRAGVEALRHLVRNCVEWSIPIVTVYAFSTENWKRPADEVSVLMQLLAEYMKKELDELNAEGVRIRGIGDLEALPPEPREEIYSAMRSTETNKLLQLNIALNYGGRAEITRAARLLASEAAEGLIKPGDISEDLLASRLYTNGIPDPDLLIRPSGEMRLSNFLLWQVAYAEIWVSKTLWPDFSREDLFQALLDYQGRDRRFGGLSNSGDS